MAEPERTFYIFRVFYTSAHYTFELLFVLPLPLSVLSRCHTILRLKRLYKMATVRKSRLLTDVVHILIGEQQQILRLAQTDKLNIFLARLPIHLAETLGKI